MWNSFYIDINKTCSVSLLVTHIDYILIIMLYFGYIKLSYSVFTCFYLNKGAIGRYLMETRVNASLSLHGKIFNLHSSIVESVNMTVDSITK